MSQLMPCTTIIRPDNPIVSIIADDAESVLPHSGTTTIRCSRASIATARKTLSVSNCLEMWQQRAGLGNSPRSILEELARIQSHDVVLPTATRGQIRLRCVTQPDAAQAALLDRLGVVLLKRMRLAEHQAQTLAAIG